jgi:predicted helicase
LIEDYKYVDGKHFGEKKHWLQDDYVKFIRFGQWKIDRTGEGILGFITNHSYLDNPTFRGMRQSLMKSFDEIYVLNLHGNSLKKEKCPDGSKDENVFDIRQGVAIGLFVKKKEQKENGIAKVYYAEQWGLREAKYKWLLQNDRTTTEWQELKPKSPFYFFVPREETYQEEYEKYWKITDIFPVNCAGIVTARDKFVIDFDREALKGRIEMFRDLSKTDEFIKRIFKLKDTRGWKFSDARGKLAEDYDWDTHFAKILYRPFDIRAIYYTQKMVDWPRPKVMRHMIHENLGLLFTRPQSPKYGFSVMASIKIIDQCSVGNKSAGAGISYIAPLYIYPDKSKVKLLDETAFKPERTPNFTAEFLQAIKEALGTEPTPEEIFYYIYAVLYSPTYRKRYAEFLKYDFPRVPLPQDYEKFKNLSELGKELVELHLLKHPSLSETEIGFPVSGSNTVEKVSYDEATRRVYFNKEQYFEGVSKEVWEYQIGGYQVMAKYLKDRKGRELSLEEIEHYRRVAKAIERTIEVQGEVDEVYGIVTEG